MKKKRNGAVFTTPKQASDKFLQPIAEATASERGSKKRLAEMLTERTGQPVPRERVERWINPNKLKRQQPLLGSGLLLMEEFRKLFANTKKKPN